MISSHSLRPLYSECAQILKGALSALSGCKKEDLQGIADLNLLTVSIVQALGPFAPELLVNVLRTIPSVGHEDAVQLINITRSGTKGGNQPIVGIKEAVKAFNHKYVVGKAI